MYAHEGPGHMLDRIWTMRTDGSQITRIHQRTMEMESATHEWWSADGKTIWYQVDYPAGWQTLLIDGYNLETGARVSYRVNPDGYSIHHHSSPDGAFFCGDGNRSNRWIVLCRPLTFPDDHSLGTHLIKGGYFQVEKLANMSKQNYLLEPNAFFTPDQRLVVFASNMFGPSYVFGVEVAKAASP
jgi:oligogalacturonide lyase